MTFFSSSPIAIAKTNIEKSQNVKPGLIERISQKLSGEQAEVEAVKARLAEKEAEAAAIANQFNTLVNVVSRETENLERASAKFQSMQGELQNLESIMLDGWANDVAPNYGRIIALRAAIADFPRVKDYLKSKVSEAQRKLEVIEKAHD